MPTGRPVEITRTELSAAELRRAAACSRDADAVRRMLALALVLEGRSRKEAAESCGMDRQTLRDWVVRYNAEGLAGPSDRAPPGPTFRLTPEQMAELSEIVEAGPDPAMDHVVRWRRVDLRRVIAVEAIRSVAIPAPGAPQGVIPTVSGYDSGLCGWGLR